MSRKELEMSMVKTIGFWKVGDNLLPTYQALQAGASSLPPVTLSEIVFQGIPAEYVSLYL